jgi:NitT/TauT family transport system substrate-binding protein
LRRIGAALLATVILAGGALHPGATQVSAARTHKTLQTIRVGTIPIADLLPLDTAVYLGFMRQAGIKVQLTPMAGGAVIFPAIQGGSIDVGIGAVTALLAARSSGLNLVDITPGIYETRAHPAHAILVAKDSTIKTGKDFEGKTVATNTLNSVDHIGMMYWIEKHGGDPSKVKFTEIPFPNMLQPLAQGQIDAALESEPAITAGTSQLGMKIVGYDFADVNKLTLLGTFVGLKPWVKKHQALVRAFAAGWMKGFKWDQKHPVQARTILEKYAQMPHSLASSIKLSILRPTKPQDFNYWNRLCVKYHVIPSAVKTSTLLWPTARK